MGCDGEPRLLKTAMEYLLIFPISFACAFAVAASIRIGRGSPWRDDFDAELVRRVKR